MYQRLEKNLKGDNSPEKKQPLHGLLFFKKWTGEDTSLLHSQLLRCGGID